MEALATIPGTQIKDYNHLDYLRHEVADLLETNPTSFPGCQPVSFERKHIDKLLQEE
jgi:mRNA guanylyltransferase